MTRPSAFHDISRRSGYLSATRSNQNPRFPTLQCSSGRQGRSRGRDPNSQWVHWLASSRLNSPRSKCGTLSSSPSSSSRSRASSQIGDSKHLASCSSATSYFALLSANEDGCHDGRPSANPKQNGNTSGLNMQDTDSSWVAWFNECWDQQRLPDIPDKTVQEGAPPSEQCFLDLSKTMSPSEIQQLQMQRHSLPQDSHNALVSNTTTANSSAVRSPVGTTTTSPWASPSTQFWDSDIDCLDNLTESLLNFSSTSPFDPISTPANGVAEPCATAGLDGDFAWLGEQDAFPLNLNDELGKSSPSSKRGREAYSPDCTNDCHTHLDDIASKKQKTFHQWAKHFETSSQFPYGVFR